MGTIDPKPEAREVASQYSREPPDLGQLVHSPRLSRLHRWFKEWGNEVSILVAVLLYLLGPILAFGASPSATSPYFQGQVGITSATFYGMSALAALVVLLLTWIGPWRSSRLMDYQGREGGTLRDALNRVEKSLTKEIKRTPEGELIDEPSVTEVKRVLDLSMAIAICQNLRLWKQRADSSVRRVFWAVVVWGVVAVVVSPLLGPGVQNSNAAVVAAVLVVLVFGVGFFVAYPGPPVYDARWWASDVDEVYSFTDEEITVWLKSRAARRPTYSMRRIGD